MKNILLITLFLIPNAVYAYSLECKSALYAGRGLEIHHSEASNLKMSVLLYDDGEVFDELDCDILMAQSEVVLSLYCSTLGNDVIIAANIVVKDGVGQSYMNTTLYDQNQNVLGRYPVEQFTCGAM